MTTMAFSIEHVRPPRPLRFSESDPEWDMGQSTRHFKLCVFLWEMLRRAGGPSVTVGADNFVYFDAANDTSAKKCAPDAFVKLGVPDADFNSWKTWEKGTPELCVEILSPSDTQEPITLTQKLERFHSMGVREVVCLDVDAAEGARLRAWDRIEGDLVERVVKADRTPCLTLERWFHVGPLGGQPVALVVADDEAGHARVLTNEGAVAALEDALRRAEEHAAAAEEHAAAAAERVAAAEAQLACSQDMATEATLRAEKAEARLAQLEASLAATKD
ncbi:hypothetical protein BH09MYX1_BH09MYX1_04930 [soil metagenome]